MAQPQLSGKVSQERKNRFQILRGNHSFSDFIEILLDSFENQSKTPKETIPAGYISPQAQKEALLLKDNEIGRAQTAASLMEDEVVRLKELVRQSEATTIELLEKLGSNPAPQPEPANPGETQMVIEINPFVLFAIDDEIQAEEKKNKVKYSRGGLLLNSFLHMKSNGRVDACRIWSDSEFKKYKEQYLQPTE